MEEEVEATAVGAALLSWTEVPNTFCNTKLNTPMALQSYAEAVEACTSFGSDCSAVVDRGCDGANYTLCYGSEGLQPSAHGHCVHVSPDSASAAEAEAEVEEVEVEVGADWTRVSDTFCSAKLNTPSMLQSYAEAVGACKSYGLDCTAVVDRGCDGANYTLCYGADGLQPSTHGHCVHTPPGAATKPTVAVAAEVAAEVPAAAVEFPATPLEPVSEPASVVQVGAAWTQVAATFCNARLDTPQPLLSYAEAVEACSMMSPDCSAVVDRGCDGANYTLCYGAGALQPSAHGHCVHTPPSAATKSTTVAAEEPAAAVEFPATPLEPVLEPASVVQVGAAWTQVSATFCNARLDTLQPLQSYAEAVTACTSFGADCSAVVDRGCDGANYTLCSSTGALQPSTHGHCVHTPPAAAMESLASESKNFTGDGMDESIRVETSTTVGPIIAPEPLRKRDTNTMDLHEIIAMQERRAKMSQVDDSCFGIECNGSKGQCEVNAMTGAPECVCAEALGWTGANCEIAPGSARMENIVCENTCFPGSDHDGFCEDGAFLNQPPTPKGNQSLQDSNYTYSGCALGTDCDDCGPRQVHLGVVEVKSGFEKCAIMNHGNTELPLRLFVLQAHGNEVHKMDLSLAPRFTWSIDEKPWSKGKSWSCHVKCLPEEPGGANCPRNNATGAVLT